MMAVIVVLKFLVAFVVVCMFPALVLFPFILFSLLKCIYLYICIYLLCMRGRQRTTLMADPPSFHPAAPYLLNLLISPPALLSLKRQGQSTDERGLGSLGL